MFRKEYSISKISINLGIVYFKATGYSMRKLDNSKDCEIRTHDATLKWVASSQFYSSAKLMTE